MITVWYLIIAYSAGGGTVAVPQVSREACLASAAYIQAHKWDDDTPRFGFCVAGAKQ